MRFYYYDPSIEFDRLFDDALAARFAPTSAVTRESNDRERLFRPRMDLHENRGANIVTATFELPGLKPEDISIEIQQNHLTVSGEFKKTESRDEAGYVVRERRQGKFSRMLQLPIGVKSEDVKAKLENGLLMLTFPQVVPEQQPHRITVS